MANAESMVNPATDDAEEQFIDACNALFRNRDTDDLYAIPNGDGSFRLVKADETPTPRKGDK